MLLRIGNVLVCALLFGSLCFGQTREAIERTELGNLQNYYATLDPQYQRVVEKLPELEALLTELKTASPAQCTAEIDTALRRTVSARQSSEQPQYGNIRALLFTPGENDENRLAKVESCLGQVDTPLLTQLRALNRQMQQDFDGIDLGVAKRKAKEALGKVVVDDTPVVGSCENIDLEQGGFKIRSFRIEDPFKFLPWVKARQQRASDAIQQLFKSQDFVFTYTSVSGKALDIIERENFLPDTSDLRVKFRVEVVGVQNCIDGQVDVIYRIYSTQIMPVLSASTEARTVERESPQTATGQTTVEAPESSPFHFKPIGGYDSTNLFYGGARLEVLQKRFFGLPFKSILVQGEGSSRMHRIAAALSGGVDSEVESQSWLAHAKWSLNFENYALPTGTGTIKGGHLVVQFSGVSKPLANGNLVVKFGGAVNGGNRQSDVPFSLRAPDTVPNAGFGTLKLYGGVDSRLSHNIFSASYGLELGSVGPSKRVDWRKQILDVKHNFWYAFGDHRLLDLESQFTFGDIGVSGRIPFASQFFGGNNEEFLIADDDWEIRANPVIRAIPGSKFFLTPDGAGSRRFFSYNFTGAYAVWRKSLVPEELTSDPEFKSQLDGSLTTVTSTLQNYFASKDPHFGVVVSQLPATQSALEDLKSAVATSQAAHPGQATDLFKACTRAVSGALRRMASAIDPQGADQYGLVTFILSDDPDEIQLVKVNQTCGNDLGTVINDVSVSAGVARVESLRKTMLEQFNQIDQATAARKAKAEMTFTRRTLNTLFNEVNIYSISPVIVFDVARIGPAKNSLGGVRYGPGAGIRFELASVAQFTLGYAWNVKHGPGEGRGNIFFSIGVRDLFH
jgi:hypothetical protein